MERTRISVEIFRPENLKGCCVGTKLNLWMSPDSKIFVYKMGSLGKEGLIGFIPNSYFDLISPFVGNWRCSSSIVLLNTGRCDIEVRIESDSSVTDGLKEQYDSIVAKIAVKYKPKNGFQTDIDLPKDHKLNIGQALTVKGTSPEDFIGHMHYKGYNHPIIELNLIDSNNICVARKNLGNDRYKIIKAQLNGYSPKLTILSIETPDKYHLPYIESIKSMANVEFDYQ